MSLRSWLRRRRLDLDEDDFRDEIRAHLAMAEADRRADGDDPDSARYGALREFGNVTLTTEAARRVWMPRWVEWLRDLMRDVRYAVRGLARTPAFSLTVVAVLAVGIGLNATVFTMLKGFALNPLSGVDRAPDLVVAFGETSAGRQLRISYPDYRYLRDHVPAFAEVAGSNYFQAYLGRGREARPISAELVTGNYFQLLGVGAELGRTLLPSDETAPGRNPVVVISDSLWRVDLGADPGIVGRTIEINNFQLTVVGVAAAEFHGTIVSYDIQAFVPVVMMAEMGLNGGRPDTPPHTLLSDRLAGVVFPHAFLRPGASLASAAAEVDAAWTVLSRDRPADDSVRRLRVVPFWQSPTGGQSYILPLLVAMSAMGLLVLAVACANIAGLVLVRGVSRRGEIAVRLALGASRWRIVRLLALENVVLAIPGATLGLVLAWQLMPPMVHYAERAAIPQRLYLNVGVDLLVVFFVALVACGSAVVFGLVPALRSSRVDLVSTINGDASPRSAARSRMRTGLVIGQVAVSLLLLVGAELTSRSLEAARQADPGFARDHVTNVAVDVSQNGYEDTRGRDFYRRLLDAARGAGGIESATLALYHPLAFLETRSQPVVVQGYTFKTGEDHAFLFNVVGPDYFQTLRIPLVAGREFNDHDDELAEPVAIVNRTFAERFWGTADGAPGRRIQVGTGGWRTVVGVASDIKYLQINESPRPYVYLPFLQSYRPNMILHTRGSAPDEALVRQARGLVASLDADLPIWSARPLGEAANPIIFFELMAAALFVFGVAGMVLAAMGTYGLVSYVVRQSTHEIGIRMALGASGRSVVRAFLARGLALGAVGAAFGLGAALGVGTLLGGLLFGVSPTDGMSFAQALAIVMASVAVATLVPAWRASRTDPLAALRHQ